MTKNICNICGKDCNDEKFILPVQVEYELYGSLNALYGKYQTVVSENVNLCMDCRVKIANFLKTL